MSAVSKSMSESRPSKPSGGSRPSKPSGGSRSSKSSGRTGALNALNAAGAAASMKQIAFRDSKATSATDIVEMAMAGAQFGSSVVGETGAWIGGAVGVVVGGVLYVYKKSSDNGKKKEKEGTDEHRDAPSESSEEHPTDKQNTK